MVVALASASSTPSAIGPATSGNVTQGTIQPYSNSGPALILFIIGTVILIILISCRIGYECFILWAFYNEKSKRKQEPEQNTSHATGLTVQCQEIELQPQEIDSKRDAELMILRGDCSDQRNTSMDCLPSYQELRCNQPSGVSLSVIGDGQQSLRGIAPSLSEIRDIAIDHQQQGADHLATQVHILIQLPSVMDLNNHPTHRYGYDGACDDDGSEEETDTASAPPDKQPTDAHILATREYTKALGAAKLARIDSKPSPNRAFPTDPGSSCEPSPNEHPDGHIDDKAVVAKMLASGKRGYFGHHLDLPKPNIQREAVETPANEVAMFHMDGGNGAPELNPHRGARAPNPTSVGYHDSNEAPSSAQEHEDEAVRAALRPPPGSGREGFLQWEKYKELPTP